MATRTHKHAFLLAAGLLAGASSLAIAQTAADLVNDLVAAQARNGLHRRLGFWSAPDLLLVDELGYLPFEKRSAHLFFQLVARRYEHGSMFVTTNQVVSQWGTVFGDDVLAAAILDRLLHPDVYDWSQVIACVPF